MSHHHSYERPNASSLPQVTLQEHGIIEKSMQQQGYSSMVMMILKVVSLVMMTTIMIVMVVLMMMTLVAKMVHMCVCVCKK